MSPASHAMSMLRRLYAVVLHRMRLLQSCLEHGLRAAPPADLEELEPKLMLSASLAMDEPDMPPYVTAGRELTFTGPLDLGVEDDLHVDETVDLLLTVGHGVLQAVLPGGQPASAPQIEIIGTLSQVNASLNTLTYAPAAGYAGVDAMAYLLTDDNSGCDEGAVAIAVDLAKDAPVLSVPASAAMVKNSQFHFSPASPPLEIIDPDGPGALYEATLIMDHGGVTVSPGGAEVSGDPNSELLILGTLAEVNAALDSIVFSPAAGHVGTAGFEMWVCAWYPGDAFGYAVSHGMAAITVLAGTVPHTITAPQAPLAVADAPLRFTTAQGTGIRFVDAQGDLFLYSATCVVPVHGGVYFGPDAGTAEVGGPPEERWIGGTLDEVNTALDAMVFVPEEGYTGPAGIEIHSTKYFPACYTGWQTAYAAIDVTVYEPVLTVPAAVEGAFGGAIAVAAGDTRIAIADGLGAGAGPVYTVTLDPHRGSLEVDGVAGVTATGPAPGDDALVLSGARDALNDALATLRFIPAAHAAVAGTIAVTVAWPDEGSADPAHSRSKLIQVLVDAPDLLPPQFETDRLDLTAYRAGGMDLVCPLPLANPDGPYQYAAWLDGVPIPSYDAAMFVDPGQGVFTWRHDDPWSTLDLQGTAPGRHVVRIEASGSGTTASITLSVLVTDAAVAPTFEIDPLGDCRIGDTYVQPFRVLDPAGAFCPEALYLTVGAQQVALAEAVLVDAQFGDLDVTERFTLADADPFSGQIVLFLARTGDGDDAAAFEPRLAGRDLAGREIRLTLTATGWTGATTDYTCSLRISVDPAHTPPMVLGEGTAAIEPTGRTGTPYLSWAHQVQANLSAPVYKYELLPAAGQPSVAAGLAISELHGLLTWDADAIAAAAPATGQTTFDFIIRVTDMRGGVAERPFSLTVKGIQGNYAVRGVLFDDINGNGVRDMFPMSSTRPLIVYVVDVSGSTELPHEGSTRRQTQIDYLTSANMALINAGLGEFVDVAIVCFSGNAQVLSLGVGCQALPVGADTDADGRYDILEAAQRIDGEGITDFTTALGGTEDLVRALTGGLHEAIERDVLVMFFSDGWANGPGDPWGIGPALQSMDAMVEDRDDGISANGEPSLVVRGYADPVWGGIALEEFGCSYYGMLPPPGVDSDYVPATSQEEFLADFTTVLASRWGVDLTNTWEPGLGGQTVFIDANLNGYLDDGERFTVTDQYGCYTFGGLDEGTYTVRTGPVRTLDGAEVIPWVQTAPAEAAPHVVQIDAGGISVDGGAPAPGEVAEGVDFAFRRGIGPDEGAVAGTVFEDFNGNGLMDFESIPAEMPHIIFLMDVSDSISLHNLKDAEAAAFLALNRYLIDMGLGTSTAVSLVRYSSGPLPLDGSPPSPRVDLAVPCPEGLPGSDALGWVSIRHDTIPDVAALTPLADYDADGVLDLEERAVNTDTFSYTPYIPALEGAAKLLEHYNVAPGAGTVIFLSDGLPSDGIETGTKDIEGIKAAVRRLLALGADIKAFGIGDNALLEDLRILDPQAQVVQPEDLPRAIEAEYARILDRPLAGWTVYADLNDNGVPDDTDSDGVPDEPFAVTDGEGRYLLPGLAPGQYTLRVDLCDRPLWRLTGGAPQGLPVTVTTGELLDGVNVGAVQTTPNQPPYFTGLQAQYTAEAGKPWQLEIAALDGDGDGPVALALLNDDVEGLVLNADLGILTWTPPPALLGRSFTVSLQATDPYGLAATTQLTLTVGANQPPAVLSEPITVFNRRGGGDYQYEIEWNADGDAVTAALLDPLDAATMHLTDVTGTSATFTWTAAGIAAATAGGAETFTIRIRLTDDAGAVTLHAWSLKIVDADPGAPVFDMAWPQTVVVPGAIL
ncbi:MAG: hypothetical protein GX591_08960, partial [Planctomycetes bacterium]|nr:hypothetical protein [Planctomycetota bacterium]